MMERKEEKRGKEERGRLRKRVLPKPNRFFPPKEDARRGK